MATELKSTKLTNRNDSYVARYNGGDDPFAAFANEGGPGIQGKLLACRKGEWAIGTGSNPDPVKPGALYIGIVPSSMRGWLKWEDGKVTDARVGLIAENFLVPHRYTLGDNDEEQWKIKDGAPQDPWSKCYRLLLVDVSPPHGDVTFSGSSYGAQLALQNLCGAYSADKHLYPDALPVVALGTKTRQSRFGKQIDPVFEVRGWARVEDVKAGRKTRAKAAKISKEALAEALDDQLPD